MSEHENKNEEQFSDDPQENLNAENEILKLKMQAEFGAVFGKMSDELTPEMEQQFLQNVLKFEEEWKNRKTVTIYEMIDKPAYKKLEELTEEEVKPETKRLIELMADKGIVLQARGRYKAEVIYKFITEEFFIHEADDMRDGGMKQYFSYEEFHPNHQLDIEQTTHEFLKSWFEQSFDEQTTVLGDQMFLLTDPSKPPVFISKEEVVTRMKKVFESYTKFDECQLALVNIDVKWDDAHNRGMGFSEGGVRYNAILENGEVQKVEGPFKLYFFNEFGLWQIMHFVFPQFKWPNEE